MRRQRRILFADYIAPAIIVAVILAVFGLTMLVIARLLAS